MSSIGIAIYLYTTTITKNNELEREKIIENEARRRKKEENDEIDEARRQKKLHVEKAAILKHFEKEKKSILKVFDKDNNGIVDVLEDDGASDFLKLLNIHQSKIIEIDNNYVKNFVKISTYLNDNKNNITSLFEQLKRFNPQIALEENTMKNSSNINDRDRLFRVAASMIVMLQQCSASIVYQKLQLGYNRAGRIVDQLEWAGIIGPFDGSKSRKVLIPSEYALEKHLRFLHQAKIQGLGKGLYTKESIDDSINDMKNLSDIIAQQIQSYNLILANALSMIISATQKDLVSFYRVYEVFDRLNVFDSMWQETLSNNITSINDNLSNITDILEEINYSIYSVELSISSGLNEISNNIDSSTSLINNELKGINSSIDFNNILTGMNTIQLYNINKNTRSD